MSEEAFARSVLHLYQADQKLQSWYSTYLEGTNLGETLARIYCGIQRGELRVDQALLLCLFIGLSTERTKEKKP